MMSSKKTSQKKNISSEFLSFNEDKSVRPIVKISSKDLSFIQSENNLNAAFHSLDRLLYGFAQSVNQMCVSFFKENTLSPTDVPDDFRDLNSKILNHYNYSETTLQKTPVYIGQDKSIIDEIQKKDDNGYSNTNLKLFERITFYYDRICGQNASMQMERARKNLDDYFYHASFDVFARIAPKPNYFEGGLDKYFKTYKKLCELYQEFKQKHDILKNVIKKTKDITGKDGLTIMDISDMWKQLESNSEKSKFSEDEKICIKRISEEPAVALSEYALPSDEAERIRKELKTEKQFLKTNIDIPLSDVEFFLLDSNKKLKSYTLSELIMMHNEYNQY